MAETPKIVLKKVPWEGYTSPNVGKDYLIHVNGEQFGHVVLDRAGRSGGTSNRWSAHDKDGNKVGVTTYTRKAMEREIISHINRKAQP